MIPVRKSADFWDTLQWAVMITGKGSNDVFARQKSGHGIAEIGLSSTARERADREVMEMRGDTGGGCV